MTEPSGIRVTVADVRTCRYCMKAARAWTAERGLSWPDFVSNGIPVEYFDNLNEAIGNAVAAAARRRTQNDGR